MATLRKAADISHKVVVTGLFAFTGYNFYQIAGQVMEGRGGNKKTVGEQTQAGFIDMLRKKAEEEYTKRFDITHRDWYDKDDASYLKSVPRKEDYTNKSEK